MRRFLIPVLLAAVALPARAQSSAGYSLGEHSFNNGGRPSEGVVAVSPSFMVSLDAIGEGVAGARLAGTLYAVTSGFPSGFGPAGEVQRVRFLDEVTLAWQAEPAAIAYNLYRGLLSDVAGGSLGACQQPGVAGTSLVDTDAVPPEDGFLFLVTSIGRLGDEGTMGFDSDGDERLNAMPCP